MTKSWFRNINSGKQTLLWQYSLRIIGEAPPYPSSSGAGVPYGTLEIRDAREGLAAEGTIYILELGLPLVLEPENFSQQGLEAERIKPNEPS